jgi:Putative zinc-finger
MTKHQDNNPSSSHHDDVIKLIPWYVKDKLTDPEKTVVMQHLSGCESCLREVSICEILLDSLPEPKDSWQPSAPHFAGILANVNKLEANLTQEKSMPLVLKSSFSQRIQQLFAQTPRPVRWTLMAESLSFAFFAAFMVLPGQLSSDKTGKFETLSTVTSPATIKGRSIRLMLSEDMSTRELTELLKQAKAQIRQGPSEVGSFTIEVALDDEKQALSVLIANPKVQLAQQIE